MFQFLSMKLASLNPMYYDFGMDLDALMVRPDDQVYIYIYTKKLVQLSYRLTVDFEKLSSNIYLVMKFIGLFSFFRIWVAWRHNYQIFSKLALLHHKQLKLFLTLIVAILFWIIQHHLCFNKPISLIPFIRYCIFIEYSHYV